MKAALKRGVETGTLVQVKNSYKVSAEAKKAAKKPASKVAKKVRVSMLPVVCFVGLFALVSHPLPP